MIKEEKKEEREGGVLLTPREELERLGLKAGLEVHQQLKGRKLHSARLVRPSPEGTPDAIITRRLHTSTSELGEVDQAALREAERERTYAYAYYDTTASLVEADEEPPLPPSREALEAAVMFAKLVNAHLLKESVVMRKIVVDGSNTSGFQRTMLIALNGTLSLTEGSIGIASITLEEDAASILKEEEGKVEYDLTRLSIPLLEITTTPSLTTPRMARDAARRIGSLLRRLPATRRGLGTIRQDVNISIPTGARVELKGVQNVDDIELIILKEVERQKRLGAWRKAYAKARVEKPVRVTADVARIPSRLIQKALKGGKHAWAVRVKHGKGLFAFTLTPGLWVGRELASFLQREARVKGFVHSDELPAYGISEEDVQKLRERVNAGEDDAFILLLEDEQTMRRVISLVEERIRALQHGVPSEVRRVEEDLTTRYLRPMPGAARMYPETDLPSIRIPHDVQTPPSYEEWEAFFKEHGLRDEEARDAARDEWRGFLARLVEASGRQGYLFFTIDVKRIAREKQISLTSDALQPNGKIHPSFPREYVLEEALPLLTESRMLAANYVSLRWEGTSRREARERVKPFASEGEAEEYLKRIVKDYPSTLPAGKLVGMLMERVKGRFDNKILLSLAKRIAHDHTQEKE